MNLELTQEQIELRDTVRRFLADRAPITSHVRELLDHRTGTTDDVWKGLADMGTTGLLVPEKHGGMGMTMIEAGIVLEELGRALNPGPWQSTAVAATRALTCLDDTGEYLASIADGTTVATLGVVGNADQIGISTGADGPVLSGVLDNVADAAAANLLLIISGNEVFAVDCSSAALDADRIETIDSTRKRFRVSLVGVPARRLGKIIPAAVTRVLDDILIAWAADALGAAQALLELTVDYAKVRSQFGHPIGSFQAVQHLCVDMYETVELARGGVLHALWASDAADDDLHHLAAVRAKAFAGQVATVGDAAIQVLGGIGFTWEHDAHLYFKRLLSSSAYLGGPDRYLEELGTILAGEGEAEADTRDL